MGFFDWDHVNPKETREFQTKQFFGREQFLAAEVKLKQGEIIQPHSHQGTEVILVIKGAWSFTLRGKVVTVRTHETLSIPPGVRHSSEALEETLAVDICVRVQSAWPDEEDFLHSDPDQFLWAV